ncbi:protein translocase SEC61 complex subunit gamma [Candidatus Woesearchaeota archaeon]|nr:protein translocase SEC61 complex subunit gamma [Candidatus Woesearchaeota archaeon]
MEDDYGVENNNNSLMRFRRFVGECIRVMKVTKKPDMIEFKTILKASALGIGVLGMIGFLLFMLRGIFV